MARLLITRLLRHCLALPPAALAVMLMTAPPCAAVEPGTTWGQDYGDFRLTVAAEMMDEYTTHYLVSLAYQGTTVYSGESFQMDPSEVQTFADAPAPGLTTIALRTYSGGAHCCFETLVLILGDGMDRAVSYTPSGNTVELEDLNGDGVMEIPVADMAFDYYYLDDAHNLCHACSPYFMRWLVYDRKGWRPDRPGEFPATYEALLASMPADSTDPGELFTRAYTTLMAGGSVADADAILDNLPPEWQDVTDRALEDLQRAVRDFNPLTRIDLQQ